MILGLFDFNYYYCDSLTNSWLSKVIPIVLGTLLGFSLSKLSDLINKRKSIQKAGTDLINEIHLLKSPIEKQVSSLDNLVTELKVDKFNPPKLELNFLLNTKRIELIDRNNAMEFFAKKYKGDRKEARKKLNSLYVGLDIITFESGRIEKLWEYYLQNGTINFKEWKRNLDAIHKYCSDCVTTIEKRNEQVADDAFVSSFYNLFNEQVLAIQNENQDIFTLRDNLHKPLAELGATYRTDPRVEQLRIYNYQCFQAINELKALKEECAMKFDRISKGLTKQYFILESEISS